MLKKRYKSPKVKGREGLETNKPDKHFSDQSQPSFFLTGLLKIFNVNMYFLKHCGGGQEKEPGAICKHIWKNGTFPRGTSHWASAPGKCFEKHWFGPTLSSGSNDHLEQN